MMFKPMLHVDKVSKGGLDRYGRTSCLLTDLKLQSHSNFRIGSLLPF